MHDSYTPLGGFVQMLQMALGEGVFGGVGSGLYGMIGFLLVFIVLLIGALSFFPALALGPVAEFFQMIA